MSKGGKIMSAFYQGVLVSALVMVVLSYFYLNGVGLPTSLPFTSMSLFASVIMGAVVTILLFVISEYYTVRSTSPLGRSQKQPLLALALI